MENSGFRCKNWKVTHVRAVTPHPDPFLQDYQRQYSLCNPPCSAFPQPHRPYYGPPSLDRDVSLSFSPPGRFESVPTQFKRQIGKRKPYCMGMLYEEWHQKYKLQKDFLHGYVVPGVQKMFDITTELCEKMLDVVEEAVDDAVTLHMERNGMLRSMHPAHLVLQDNSSALDKYVGRVDRTQQPLQLVPVALVKNATPLAQEVKDEKTRRISTCIEKATWDIRKSSRGEYHSKNLSKPRRYFCPLPKFDLPEQRRAK